MLKCVQIRSSSNLEDLEGLSGAGLFDSILNVNSSSIDQIIHAIQQVWISLYSKRAILNRIQYHIQQQNAQMSVLIQQMIHSELSFIIHTKNPVFYSLCSSYAKDE